MNIKDIHVQVLVGSIDMYSRVSPWLLASGTLLYSRARVLFPVGGSGFRITFPSIKRLYSLPRFKLSVEKCQGGDMKRGEKNEYGLY